MRELARISDKLYIKLLEYRLDETLSIRAYIANGKLVTIFNKPYLEQVKAHFIEQHGVHVEPSFCSDTNNYGHDINYKIHGWAFYRLRYRTYDEALDAGLLRGCEILKRRNKNEG